MLSYDIEKVLEILSSLEEQFGYAPFPLANNVVLLGEGEEKPGLATTILQIYPGDITRAQGASYLGVILEELGYLEWNKKSYGIAWRLLPREISRLVLLERLSQRSHKLQRGTQSYVENLFDTPKINSASILLQAKMLFQIKMNSVTEFIYFREIRFSCRSWQSQNTCGHACRLGRPSVLPAPSWMWPQLRHFQYTLWSRLK